jgi:hypothetical protein
MLKSTSSDIVPVCDVINEKNAVGASVVGVCDTPKLFLTSGKMLVL